MSTSEQLDLDGFFAAVRHDEARRRARQEPDPIRPDAFHRFDRAGIVAAGTRPFHKLIDVLDPDSPPDQPGLAEPFETER